MGKFYTLSKNTFIETLRQPVYGVIIITALLLLALAPAVTMYSLDDDNKFLREICLSTLFLAGLFIAIFSASGAVAEEVEDKTIQTILSKPVSRPVFIISKFFGIAAAVALAHYICTVAMLMAIRHGVFEDISATYDWTVLGSAAIGITLTVLLSAFLNFAYDWKFSSTAVVIGAIFATFAIIFLAFIDKEWKFHPAHNAINAVDIYGAALLLFAAIIIVALAVALSARFNTVITLSVCIGIFLLGLINDYTFGRFADTHLWAKIGRFVVPNLQVFWISDAIYEGSPIPIEYILISGSYALCYTAAILLIAIALFQRRQVG